MLMAPAAAVPVKTGISPPRFKSVRSPMPARKPPLLATTIVAATGNIYAGLWYPIIVSVMTVVIGALFLRDNMDRPIHE